MVRFPSKGAVVLVAVGVLLAAGCYPKSQVCGVGNAGGLTFAVNPPDAEVILDGVSRGKASDFTGERSLDAAGGTHRLELKKPGYETYARDVYVSNARLRIEATLVVGAIAPGGS